MPLAPEGEPGSWGRLSEGWPTIIFDSKALHDVARMIMIRTGLVPYGSYVSMDAVTLRVETEKYKAALLEKLGMQPVPPTQTNTRSNMDTTTVRTLAFILAENARVAGMVAANDAAKHVGNPPVYDAHEFNCMANNIDALAKELG